MVRGRRNQRQITPQASESNRRSKTPDGDVHTEKTGENVRTPKVSPERQGPEPFEHNLDDVLQEYLKHREEFSRFLNERREENPEGSGTRDRGRTHKRRRPERSLSEELESPPRRERRPLERLEQRHRSRSPPRDQRHDSAEEADVVMGIGADGRMVTPFSQKILDTHLPGRYKTPNKPAYDGLSDPTNFLVRFNYSMLNQGLTEIHMARVFPEMLTNNARHWFDSLPRGSIKSYRDLITAFQRRFFQKESLKSTPAQLLTIKQNRGEAISDFVSRYTAETLRVSDLDDKFLISAFQASLLPGALYRELVAAEPQTSAELWKLVDRFSRADAADRRKREADRGEKNEGQKREDRGRGRDRRSAFDRLVKGRLENRLGPKSKEDQSTPLNRPRAEIYELNAHMFETPRPLTGGAKRPRDKYCLYHKDHGHDTEDCRNLINEIEKLIQRGFLKKYVDRHHQKEANTNRPKGQGWKGRRNPPKDRDNRESEDGEEDQNVTGTIYAITGLPHGETRSSLKAQARSPPPPEPELKRLKTDEVISFFKDDPVPPVHPHQDALVIRAIMANKVVHRVYIDSGASVSVLFKECYDQLDLQGQSLSPAPSTLRSFTQEEAHAEGIIGLPVTVGRAPKSVTHTIRFYVVKTPSPYNTILGRDWLNAVRAVCSWYHLTMKIPTKGGIAVIQGDQKVAKECLRISLKKGESSEKEEELLPPQA